MYHKIVVVGNLGRDPEMRYTTAGKAVTNFSMATSRRWTGQDGAQEEETIWIRVSAWGKLAEVCNQYLSKGRLVLVEGRLNPDPQTGGPRIWEGNDGQSRASFEITAQTVKFLGGKQSDSGPGGEEPPGTMEAEDIPF